MRDNTEHLPWDATSSRPRVLIECPASASPSIVAQVVQRQGFDVRTCVGPQDRGGCDLIDKGTCALVSGADVVVNMLDAQDRSAPAVLGAVMAERRPPATVVELTLARTAALRRHADGHADGHVDGHAGGHVGELGATVITTPVTSADLIHGINTAIERRERTAAWWGDGCP